MSLRSSRLGLLLGAALGLLLFVLAPRSAFAQTVTIYQKQVLPRVDAKGQLVAKRPIAQNPEGVNLQDCRDDQRIRFPLQLAGYQAGDVMEVWATDAGGDCSQPTARSGGTQTCYKLNANVPLTPNPLVDIPVKSIIAGRDPSALDATGCRRLQAKTSIDVQFLLFRGGNTGTATAKDDAPINVKTLGPAALTGVRALPGDTHITISWDLVGEGGVADVVGVRAYCDTNPTPAQGTPPTTITVCSDAATDDSGDAADGGCTTRTIGGTAGGEPIPAPSPSFDPNGVACSASVFAPVDGGRVVPDATYSIYECGSLSGITGNSIIAEGIAGAPLPNGQVIAVAVAGIDSFANVGEISDPVCQFPEETQDFWQDYKAAGGKAGGCDVSGGAGTAASSCVLAIAASFVGSMARRIRRKRNDR